MLREERLEVEAATRLGNVLKQPRLLRRGVGVALEARQRRPVEARLVEGVKELPHLRLREDGLGADVIEHGLAPASVNRVVLRRGSEDALAHRASTLWQ